MDINSNKCSSNEFVSYDETLKLIDIFFLNIKSGSGVRDDSFIEIFTSIKYLKTNFINEINEEYRKNKTLSLKELEDKLCILKSKIWNIVISFENRFCTKKGIELKDLISLGYTKVDINNEPCVIDLNNMQTEIFKYYRILLKIRLEEFANDKKYRGITKKNKKDVIEKLVKLKVPVKVGMEILDKKLNNFLQNDDKSKILENYNLIYNKLLVEMDKYLINIIKMGNLSDEKLRITENAIKDYMAEYLITEENICDIKKMFPEMKHLYIQTKKINKIFSEYRNNPFDKMIDNVTSFIKVDDYLGIKCNEVKDKYIMIYRQLNDLKEDIYDRLDEEEVTPEFLREFSKFIRQAVIKAINSIDMEFCNNYGITLEELKQNGYKEIKEVTNSDTDINLNRIDNKLYLNYKMMVMKKIRFLASGYSKLNKSKYEDIIENVLDYDYESIDRLLINHKKRVLAKV